MTRFVAVCLSACFVVGVAGCGGGGKGRHGGRKRADASAAGAAGGAAGAGAKGAASPAASLPEAAVADAFRGVRNGGTLRVHLEAEPPHLNPLLDNQQAISRVVQGLVYETLLECRGGAYHAALAESWEVGPDAQRVTLKLKAGVRWHDDRPLTAVDVQASFEPVMRSTTRVPILRAFLSDIEAVEVLPERTVRLRLLRPSHLALRALCELPILPAEALRGGAPALAQIGRQPVGTGPFRFAGWERGKRIRLTRARPGENPPHVDEILFEVDTDGARSLARARRGDLDVLPRVLDMHYPEQVTRAALRDVADLYRLTPDRYSFLVLNHAHPPLGDVRFRRALSSLWDRERRADEVHRGLARGIGGPTFAAIAGARFDRAAAARLLDEMGLADTNADGVRELDGKPVRLTILQPAGARAAAAETRAYAHDLRRVGILLDTAVVDPALMFARLKQGEFDLAPMMWEGRRDDDPRPLFAADGPFNFTRARLPRVDAALDEVRLADGPERRRGALHRLAEVLADELPVVFLYRHDVAALLGRRVHAVAAAGDHVDLRRAWVDP